MPVTLRIMSNVRAALEGDYKPSAIDKLLRFRPEGYQWSPSFKMGNWDGWVRLFNKGNEEFPAGCWPLVKDYFDVHHVKCEVRDFRSVPFHKGEFVVPRTLLDKKRGSIDLRPDQRKTIRLAVAATRGVVKSATGSGKTEVMAGILTTLVRRTLTGLVPPKTLVIVPNRNLVNETSRRLEERLGITVGRISHGKWDERDITVALPATLGAKKYKSALAHLMPSLDVIMVDECHHSPSKSWYSVISKCQAYYRYGFSGTPLDRSDGSNLRLIAVTGPLIVDIESATLVAQGILAKPFVNIVEVTEPMLPDEGVPYSDVYALGIVKNINFHKAVVQQVIAERKKNHSVMVLVTQIDHGHYLDKRLWSMADFIPHRFIWAEMPNSEVEIEKAKKEFKSGLLPVLIASPIFGEGTDLPNVDTIIIADGGKSVIRVIQKVGRAMRKKATGPNRCKIIDFAHYTHPYLAKHSLKRINIYETEGFTFC